MVCISFSFDLGRYHGTAWRVNVNEGSVEWPPSPWRVLRSLIAAVLTDSTLAETDREGGLAVVGKLALSGPPSYRIPPTIPAHSRHYFPDVGTKGTDLVLDGFLAIDPSAALTVTWPAELSREEDQALRLACERVRYLGRSESLCTATLSEEGNDSRPIAAPTDGDVAEGAHVVHLLTPRGEDPLSTLTASPDEVRRQRRKLPPGTVEVPYSVPQSQPSGAKAVSARADRPTIAIFRLSGGYPGLKDAVFIGESLRGLMQSAFDHGKNNRRSPTFSGHGSDGKRIDQHQHAHYLSLPGNDRRLIERLVVWAPEGFGPEEIEAIAKAARSKLRISFEGDRAEIGLVALGDETTVDLPDLLGPTCTWESVTPFMMPRHTKRRGGRVIEGLEEQVERELRLRARPPGWPANAELVSIRHVPGDWSEFRRRGRRGGPGDSSKPTLGVRLEFNTPVAGPLSLGALSHFGLGLFAPASDS